ncbi:MAG TPA: AAA family ATPase [Candidatus Dormibacteraeota bacterium]|nr:AAA family ATPase [Candidatus Dormibacteraeota bacterium]
MSGRRDREASVERWLKAHRVDVSALQPENVIGIGHVTAEVAGLVARLRDPLRAERMGAEVPRGILFYGGPGLGKTLVARSVARALGDTVPFYEVSADELTPARIRGALSYLSAAHPRSVLYIDEIDTFGMSRDYEGHEGATRLLLTATLAALDGLAARGGPLLIASSNRAPRHLAPALVRAGRIGFKVRFSEPDEVEREQLLRLFARHIPQDPAIGWADLAGLTRGSTPADLRQMVADAAGLAVAASREQLTQLDLATAVRRAGELGPESSSPHRDWRRSAIHEAGHVAVATVLRGPSWVRAVRLTDKGGATSIGDEDRQKIDQPDDEMLDLIATKFGGIAAEQALLGSAGFGGEEDVSSATGIALSRYHAGLSRDPAPMDGELFGDPPDSVREAAAAAVREAIEQARQQAIAIVAANVDAIARLAEIIEREGELAGSQLRQTIESVGFVAPGAFHVPSGELPSPLVPTLIAHERPRAESAVDGSRADDHG